jgi:hypothetical protein
MLASPQRICKKGKFPMTRLFCALTLCSLFALSMAASAQVTAVPPALQYQGRLTTPSGNPVPDGNYTLTFRLFDAETGGTQISTQTINNVPVRNGIIAILIGLFTPADFSGNRWLEVQIGNNPALTPRQRLVSVPYAFKAGSVVDGVIVTNSLASNAVTTAKILDGTIGTADIADNAVTSAKIAANTILGADIANATITADKLAVGVLPSAWLLTGNAGTSGGTNFLGTTDDQPLVLKVNNFRAVRYASVENTATAGLEYRGINTVGGNVINSATNGSVGVTIAGGGRDYFTAGDEPNSVSENFGFIGGGANNTVGGEFGAVAGGRTNTASGTYSGVLGGNQNTASGSYSTVGGGFSNIASGTYATVPGGFDNQATGLHSIAMGRNTRAVHNNVFLFNTNLGDLTSARDNTFIISADGGVGIGFSATDPQALLHVAGNSYFALNMGIGTTNPLTKLHVEGSLHLSGTTQDISTDVGNNLQFGHYDGTTFTERMLIDGTGHVGINDTNPTYRLELPNIAADGDGRARANRWDTYSSGRWKHNVVPIENALEKVLKMRGVMFDWNPEHGGTRDIGFVAEEVGNVIPELVSWEADGKFALGMAYDRVTALLVEAVKQQQGQRERDRATMGRLQTENALLQTRIDTLQSRLDMLEKALLRSQK